MQDRNFLCCRCRCCGRCFFIFKICPRCGCCRHCCKCKCGC
ncbi:hypothetical protein LZ906_010690 [Paraclostridium ghonii]|nr:hypothetical protein [Paeniclostridium ghonii]